MEEKENTHTIEALEENHQGRNLQRIRIYLGMKQEVLAEKLGISQSQISAIEQQAVIDDELRVKIGNELGITPDLIKKFDIERAIYNINNYKDTTINGANNGSGALHQNINPLEKVIELYERLLASEREKLELLIKNKK